MARSLASLYITIIQKDAAVRSQFYFTLASLYLHKKSVLEGEVYGGNYAP